MNTLQENPTITEKIYQIRGVSVMIDKDLALLYGVQTKQLNRAVKRNIERFPEDFMFQLTKEECLRCQIGTLNTEQGQHLKYMPYAFRSVFMRRCRGGSEGKRQLQRRRSCQNASRPLPSGKVR